MRTSIWRVLGTVVAVVAVVAATACGHGSSLRAASNGGAEPLEISLIGLVRDLHTRMVTDRLPLFETEVVAAVARDSDLTITIVPKRVVWAPTGAPGPVAAPVTLALHDVPAPDVGYWQTASLPATALAVYSDGELFAIAPTSRAGGEIVTGQLATSGPLFLGRAADWLASAQYTPVPEVVDHCGQVASQPVADTPRAALTDYLTRLGDTPESVVQAREAHLRRQAESLAVAAPTTRDPVTGDYVQVSANHLYEQLVDGVDPEQLDYEPTVPVTVDVSGLAPAGQGDPATQAAVFIDARTSQVLGWIPVVGTWGSQDGAVPTASFQAQVEIRRPTPGSEVGVLLRGIDTARFDCPPAPGESVDYEVLVPYDDIAGESRSLIRLRSRSYHVVATGRH